ncbi:metacaspase-5-like, partial [Trifolium medium]|nr:metacaspase-5-like [Trifolium medium]
KVKNFVKFVLNKLKHGGGENEGHGGILGLVNNLAEGLLKHMLQIDDNEENENPVEPAEEAYATSTKRNIVDSGILLSGCQTDQTSADASPNGNSDEAYGAFSNAIQAIIAGKDVVTNRELILK